MHITSKVITGTIEKGEIATTDELTAFPDGTEIVIVSKDYFYLLAGSDSTRHQLEQAQQALKAVAEQDLPEPAKTQVAQALGVKP